MPKQPNNIRDLRESKNLSQDKVAEAAGLTYSRFVRIEEGSGKTTPEEVKSVLDVLKKMEPGTRKLAGRPFKDPKKQAAVQAARQNGGSVAEALGLVTSPVPAKTASSNGKKASPAKKSASKDMAKALAKKSPAPRKAAAKKGS